MAFKLIFLQLFFLILMSVNLCTNALKGAVPLDSWTFDKVLANFDAALVKFDVSYPYGEKEDEYGKVSEAVKNTPNFIVAEVGVQDYGDKENSDLSERYGIKKEEFPSVKLFIKGKKEPISFTGDFKMDTIKSFIMEHSSVRLILDKCLPAFDDLAIKFMKSNGKEKAQILEQAKKLAGDVNKKDEKKSAEVYIKMMEKITERGKAFVASEKERVSNIKKGKITDSKKEELQGRLNIIQSFAYKSPKDEL